MSVNLHRVLDGLDGEYAGANGMVDVDAAADVEPGEAITLRLETDGPGAAPRAIAVELSPSEARLLGGRLLDATE
ncbi:hypothetical protein [Halovivax sp.]|uniref:hypothetical protein n=1 Tax=Halovivax sp. TaxID=1935978 RepID=UPI0025C57369|nr:hypothetical protein [Halovivax sp.]